eukprot:529142-Pelagomonas_calceolata.AAC.1
MFPVLAALAAAASGAPDSAAHAVAAVAKADAMANAMAKLMHMPSLVAAASGAPASAAHAVAVVASMMNSQAGAMPWSSGAERREQEKGLHDGGEQRANTSKRVCTIKGAQGGVSRRQRKRRA